MYYPNPENLRNAPSGDLRFEEGEQGKIFSANFPERTKSYTTTINRPSHERPKAPTRSDMFITGEEAAMLEDEEFGPKSRITNQKDYNEDFFDVLQGIQDNQFRIDEIKDLIGEFKNLNIDQKLDAIGQAQQMPVGTSKLQEKEALIISMFSTLLGNQQLMMSIDSETQEKIYKSVAAMGPTSQDEFKSLPNIIDYQTFKANRGLVIYLIYSKFPTEEPITSATGRPVGVSHLFVKNNWRLTIVPGPDRRRFSISQAAFVP